MPKFILGGRPTAEASATYLRILAANYHCDKYKEIGKIDKHPYLVLVIEFSSTLFELMAAFNLLLQELNLYYHKTYKTDLLPVEIVNLKELRKKLEKQGKESDLLLKEVEDETGKGWFKDLKEMRNHITHRGLIELADFIYVNIPYNIFQEPIPAPEVLKKYPDPLSLMEENTEKMKKFVNEIQGKMYKSI